LVSFHLTKNLAHFGQKFFWASSQEVFSNDKEFSIPVPNLEKKIQIHDEIQHLQKKPNSDQVVRV